MAYLECRQIRKSYGAVVALTDATLSLEAGEIRALFGGNGSGKSTLAKILGSAVSSDGGEIWFDGERIEATAPRDARERGIIFTSQELSLFRNLTVEENLAIAHARARADNRQSLRGFSDSILGKLSISELRNRKIDQLSDNQKYLVEFAKAVVARPRLLIIDEVTSSLYRDEVELVRQVIGELAKQGTAVLFISHRLHEIYAICSHATVMRNGRVIETYDLSTVSDDRLVSEMIGSGTKEAASAVAVNGDLVGDNSGDGGSEVLFAVDNLSMTGFHETLDVSLKRGEMIGVAGLQGQGQSHFLKTLFGMHTPVHVTMEGTRLKIDSPAAAVKASIAYLSGDRQSEGAFYGRTISENLEIVNREVLKRREMDEAHILGQFAVKYDSSFQEIQTLSGGNQQKVVAARWIGAKPRLLLADDPTKGIDVGTRRDFHKILAELVAEGLGVIMSSSDDEELIQLAEVVSNYRVAVMYDGGIVRIFQKDELSLSKIISASIPRTVKSEQD